MEGTKVEAKSLQAIDLEVEKHHFSPSEYEIIRRVIYETGDFNYLSQIYFSDRVLSAGAAALAARTPIIVDSPMVEAGIADEIENSFTNPIYCCFEDHPRYHFLKLAKCHPEGIFIIGREATTFSQLFHLIEQQEIQPALLIITFPKLVAIEGMKKKLHSLTIPNIHMKKRKGNVGVAVGIVRGLIDLAWEVYSQSEVADSIQHSSLDSKD